MTDHPDQPIGDVLDSLGITAALAPDTLVASAIVILKTVLADGTERLSVARSAGLGGIEAAGMLHLAGALDTDRFTSRRQPGA